MTELPAQLVKAERFRQKGQPDEAFREVNKYLNDNFDDVGAMALAAQIMIEAERPGLAQVILRRAVELEPNIPTLWSDLGVCFQADSDLDEAERIFKRSLSLDPNSADAHNSIGQVYLNNGQHALAIKHFDKAIELEPGIKEAYYNRSLSRGALGDFSAWHEYDADLGGRYRPERTYGMVPRWNGKPGKKLIVYGEQGIGDEISFASCVQDVAKENEVIIECSPRLHGLFKRSFGLETHPTRLLLSVPWLHDQKTGIPRKIDAAVAMGSLPQYYRKKVEDFPGTPYLIPDPERRLQWRALLDSLGPKKKIGIAWTGGNKNTWKSRRSLPLEELLPILRQDATFVSLQYMDSPEIDELRRNHGIKIHHWKRAVQAEDYDETAALVAELDLVITVQTAVVHLCGAIGQKCWAMLPKAPRWFYGISGASMPWYESVTLYRQRYQWVELISEVAHDLRNEILCH